MNAAAISTVTVQAQRHTTYMQPDPTTVQGGFCATITMDGPGLPRVANGQCGTILLVAEGTPSLEVLGMGMTFITVLLHTALWRVFY